MKKGIIIRYEYGEVFDLLTDEELGQLIMALLKWAEGRDVPEMPNIVEVAFLFITGDMEKAEKEG